MDPEKYAKFADGLRDVFQKIGLEPDTNFFRWQMSDFFGAAFIAYYFRHTAMNLLIADIQKQGLFGKSKEWYEKNASLITAVGTGTTLAAYEVVQALAKGGSLDVKDMAAYIAGLGLFLGSERIFQEYLKLKEEFGGKVVPFFRERLPVIKAEFQKPASQISELMENVEIEK